MKFCNMNLSTLFLVTLITLSVLLVPALSAPVRLVKRPKGSIISYLFTRLKKLKFFAYVPFIIIDFLIVDEEHCSGQSSIHIKIRNSIADIPILSQL